MKPKKPLETAGIYSGGDLLDRLERMAVRREQEGIYTDALICRAAIDALNERRGRTRAATEEIVREIRTKVFNFEKMPNGQRWGIAELARHYKLSEQTVRNIVDRKGAYK